MPEIIKFNCLFTKCTFTADIEWPKLDLEPDEEVSTFEPSMRGTTALIKHHNDTRITVNAYPGLGTGHGKFKGVLPNGHEIKVGVSGNTAWVEEGFEFL